MSKIKIKTFFSLRLNFGQIFSQLGEMQQDQDWATVAKTWAKVYYSQDFLGWFGYGWTRSSVDFLN